MVSPSVLALSWISPRGGSMAGVRQLGSVRPARAEGDTCVVDHLKASYAVDGRLEFLWRARSRKHRLHTAGRRRPGPPLPLVPSLGRCLKAAGPREGEGGLALPGPPACAHGYPTGAGAAAGVRMAAPDMLVLAPVPRPSVAGPHRHPRSPGVAGAGELDAAGAGAAAGRVVPPRIRDRTGAKKRDLVRVRMIAYRLRGVPDADEEGYRRKTCRPAGAHTGEGGDGLESAGRRARHGHRSPVSDHRPFEVITGWPGLGVIPGCRVPGRHRRRHGRLRHRRPSRRFWSSPRCPGTPGRSAQTCDAGYNRHLQRVFYTSALFQHPAL